MCIAVPMLVVSTSPFSARCVGRGEERDVSLLMTGPVTVGSHVLVHVDRALRVIDREEAQAIDQALDGLEAALEGKSFDHLFQDLIDRAPTLPAHLRGETE
ncbi:MAG: HypC/HybG/HupF family hydrogenase formation chaperone [Alphaproteobacteria bacterium]|nr:HypC/HybG/HupF family hydrogenase formation chaperone [Alphaproteobacteria bacterium]TAD89168.1 MAG: HypC/HybG/HupF family hydrogenase formation chaperone [Alphaproteobacteria bacterium]